MTRRFSPGIKQSHACGPKLAALIRTIRNNIEDRALPNVIASRPGHPKPDSAKIADAMLADAFALMPVRGV